MTIRFDSTRRVIALTTLIAIGGCAGGGGERPRSIDLAAFTDPAASPVTPADAAADRTSPV
ncbi:MAG: hypothetical protein KJO43_06440, partial [Phycisphaerae bacterium]|nr:hypothetical protein [Phycisphaerae bacterium]